MGETGVFVAPLTAEVGWGCELFFTWPFLLSFWLYLSRYAGEYLVSKGGIIDLLIPISFRSAKTTILAYDNLSYLIIIMPNYTLHPHKFL